MTKIFKPQQAKDGRWMIAFEDTAATPPRSGTIHFDTKTEAEQFYVLKHLEL